MSVSEDDVATVRRFYAAFATRDYTTMEACFTADAVWHLPGRGALGGDHHGWQAIHDDFLARTGPLSGGTLRAGLLDVAAGTDHIVAIQHATARARGPQPRRDGLPTHADGGRPHRRGAGPLLRPVRLRRLLATAAQVAKKPSQQLCAKPAHGAGNPRNSCARVSCVMASGNPATVGRVRVRSRSVRGVGGRRRWATCGR